METCNITLRHAILEFDQQFNVLKKKREKRGEREMMNMSLCKPLLYSTVYCL